MKKNLIHFVLLSGLLMTGFAQAKTNKPNILVIWGTSVVIIRNKKSSPHQRMPPQICSISV